MADVKCSPPNFQLELMGHDPVMRESFQKLADWLCNELPGVFNEFRTIINTEDAPTTIIRECICDASVIIGDVVRISGSICVKAQATTESASRAIGVVESKSSPTLCRVVLAGRTAEIFTGLSIDKDYYLSPTTAGAIQLPIPSGTGQFVALMGRAITSKILDVNISLRMQRA